MKQFNLCSTLFILIFTLLTGTQSFAQSGVAINTAGAAADASAMLDVSSTNAGVLIPRMTAAQKNAIINPANGLLIYQTDNYAGADTGFYYYKVNTWVPLTSVTSGTSPNLDFTFTADKTYVSVGAGFNSNTNNDPITLNLNYISGDGNPVNLSVQGLPAGASAGNLSPCGGYPTFSSTLTLNTQSSLAPGNYPFTITATGGISTKSITDTLKVIQGKTVFATSTFYSGNLGGLSGADVICQNRANAAGLSGTFIAWLSTTSVNAVNRINDGFYVRTDGVVIAKNKADLVDGAIQNPINRDEFGNIQNSNAVWTNSYADGTIVSATETCSNWSSTADYGKIGNPQSTGQWSYSGWETCNGASPYTNVVLYCFEQ